MIPFLASTMFQNQLTSNWNRSDETETKRSKHYLYQNKKPMLIELTDIRFGEARPIKINMSYVECIYRWSDDSRTEIKIITGDCYYVNETPDQIESAINFKK
jgi:hypothetical protein